MDVALLIFLVFVNALFAMSEMALTASRKARLQVMVEAGDSGAVHAIALHDDPTKWLSVVQISITFVSIVFGELVPKRLGLQYPETIARLVSRPMEWLSVITRPFVRLLTW